MARAKGFQGIVGVKKAATWGTEVVLGATDGLEVESLDVNAGADLIPDNQLTGVVTMKPSSLGNLKVDVTLKTALRYEGLEVLTALVMGTAGAPTTVDTTAKQHVLKFKNDFDGIFSTLAYEYLKDTKVGVVPGLKWNKLKISGKQGERLMFEASGIGDTWSDASATNTTTTIDTITLSANRLYAVYRDVTFLLNDQTAGSLAATPIYIQGFSLEIERPHDQNVTTERGNKTSEPLPSGFATGKLTLDFSVAQDGTGGNVLFLADQIAGTAKKAKIEITSTTLAGSATQMFQWFIWMPYVQFSPVAKPSPSQPGAISWSQEAELHHVGTIPTGFTATYVDMVTIDQFTQRTTDALA
jgi:hypothetical protein